MGSILRLRKAQDFSAERYSGNKEVLRAGSRPKSLWIHLEVYGGHLAPSHSRTETDYIGLRKMVSVPSSNLIGLMLFLLPY